MNLHDLFIIVPEIQNTELDCWDFCGSEQGPCEWCGAKGYCCTMKSNWNDTSNGCDGTFGGASRHECVLMPGKSFLIGHVIQYNFSISYIKVKLSTFDFNRQG